MQNTKTPDAETTTQPPSPEAPIHVRFQQVPMQLLRIPIYHPLPGGIGKERRFCVLTPDWDPMPMVLDIKGGSPCVRGKDGDYYQLSSKLPESIHKELTDRFTAAELAGSIEDCWEENAFTSSSRCQIMPWDPKRE